MIKNVLLVVCFAALLAVGYRLYEVNHEIGARDAKSSAPGEPGKAPGTAAPAKTRLEQLGEQVAAQEKIVARLDARLSELSNHPTNGAVSRKRDELEAQGQRVAELENQLAYYKAAMASGKARLAAQRQQNEFARRSAIEDATARARRDEQQIKELTRKLADPKKSRMSPSDMVDALNKANELKGELMAAQRQAQSARAYNPGQGLVPPDAGAVKDIEKNLAEEKKRYRELEQQFMREEKADDNLFHQRDKIENEFQSARIRLQQLKDQLEAEKASHPER